MINFNQEFLKKELILNKEIYHFNLGGINIDKTTVESFGEEWEKFASFSEKEISNTGDLYFNLVDKNWLEDKNVLDVGCGTGRWMHYVSDLCAHVDGVDPSKAVYSAAKLLETKKNIRISISDVDNIPFAEDSFDLVYSLGVLHHIPNTLEAMKSCVKKLKKDGYFLVYLYYSFDNRGKAFKAIFFLSNIIRKFVSSLPSTPKKIFSDILAVVLYTPFILVGKFFKAIGLSKFAEKIPLSAYQNQSWNIVRNDSLDRFGTPLEQRFSKVEIESMMAACGLKNIKFSESIPFWCAIGQKI
jgi:SAM-dependent methyltransferase